MNSKKNKSQWIMAFNIFFLSALCGYGVMMYYAMLGHATLGIILSPFCAVACALLFISLYNEKVSGKKR